MMAVTKRLRECKTEGLRVNLIVVYCAAFLYNAPKTLSVLVEGKVLGQILTEWLKFAPKMTPEGNLPSILNIQYSVLAILSILKEPFPSLPEEVKVSNGITGGC